MKKVGVVVVATIIIVLMLGVVCFYYLRDYEVGTFKSFYYSSASGWSIYDNVWYDIKCDDKCIAKVKPAGIPDEEARTYTLSNDEVDKINNIFEKYHVKSWNGFNKSDSGVLDGTSFTFELQISDNQSVKASGYMKFPSHYHDVIGELEDVLEKDYDWGNYKWNN